MNVRRILRHWFTGDGARRRSFPHATLERIEAAVAQTERSHSGQVRFVVEAALDTQALLAGQSGRERAIDVFSLLRVWDTERNNGVLVYVLLADRDVEIVADRGIHRLCGPGAWESVCRAMEAEFRAGRFEHGALAGIRAVGEHLERHFPGDGAEDNELPDAPVLM